MSDEDRRNIADRLHVPLAAVERMESHFSRPDRSLNAAIGGEETDEMQDFLPDLGPSPEEIVTEFHDNGVRTKWLHTAMKTLTPRERDIIRLRFLGDERITLAEIGKKYGVTKERIRQVEGKALAKLRKALDEIDVDMAEMIPA